MTVLIMKHNARKALVVGKVNVTGFYPDGIGGIEGRTPCYGFHVGDHRVVISESQLVDLLADWRRASGRDL